MKRLFIPLTLALIASPALATPKDALVYQIASATASVEPAQAVVTYDVLPVQQMFEGLYLDNFGKYEPLLAISSTLSKDGKTTTYDSGDHKIGGVSQQDGGCKSLTFTGQNGDVDLGSLKQVD